jgi:hypothetical protein
MKRFFGGTIVLIMLVVSISPGQELSIGPSAGALFMQGPRGHEAGMRERGMGSSFSFGGEVVYSLSTVPLDIIGQASFSPGGGRFFRRDSLGTSELQRGRRGGEGSLFSMGVGGRWIPLRGPVSPYLGVSFLLSHMDGSGDRFDSTRAMQGETPPTAVPGREGDFRRGGGTTDFGVGLSVGGQFAVSSLIRFDVGASYSFYSPFSRGGNTGAIAFGASMLFTLF